jgi:TolB protein
MLRFLVLLLVGVIGVSDVQAERPVLVIEKSRAIPIQVLPVSGTNAAEIKRVLENDLNTSGVLTASSSENPEYTAVTSFNGSVLTGTLKNNNGALFTKNFSGDWRKATHEFNDAIVEAVSGQRGIATSKIYFVSVTAGNKEIYESDIDGGNTKQLTNDKVISRGPKLSFDGKQLAYTSYKSGYPDVWVIDLDSRKRQNVSHFPGLNTGGTISPDGSRMAVILSKDGNTELYVMGIGSSSATRLTKTLGTEASPVWSPSGDEIAYVSDDQGSPQIFVISASGGKPRRIGTGSIYSTEPSWSPDGKKIAFSVRSGGAQIGVVDLSTGKSELFSATAGGESPSWARNSRHIVYASGGRLCLFDTITKKNWQISNNLSRNSEPFSSK